MPGPPPDTPKSSWSILGNGDEGYRQYVDFGSSTVFGHYTYKTFTFRQPDVKFHPLDRANNEDDGHCFEIVTTPHPSGVVADTRIWFWNPTTRLHQSLNDDNNGTPFSRGRIFVDGPGSNVYTYIAAFDSSHNSDHFMLTVQKLNLTEFACTDGQTTVPWIKSINDVMTVGPTAR